MKQLAEDDRRMLESLNKSVRDALERKRRLGQYAIVWRDGRPQRIEPTTSDLVYSTPPSGTAIHSEVRESRKDEPHGTGNPQ